MLPGGWIYSLGGHRRSGELLHGLDGRKSLGKGGDRGMRVLGSVLGPSGLKVSGHECIRFMAGLGLDLICPRQP